jgi:hypothetical protein
VTDQMQVTFVPLPIQLACPVPVTADGRTLDDDGEPIPVEEREHRCAVWAHWMIGGQVSCDYHTLIACEALGIDFDGLVLEAGRKIEDARKPWGKRRRSTQADADMTHNISAAHFPTGESRND